MFWSFLPEAAEAAQQTGAFVREGSGRSGRSAGVGRGPALHICVVPLAAGRVRDLRNGAEHGGDHQKVQTCITVAAGDCVLDV